MCLCRRRLHLTSNFDSNNNTIYCDVTIDSPSTTPCGTNAHLHATFAPLYYSRNRQKSAVRILKNRGYGRWGIIKFGFKRKVNSKGMVVALAQTLGQAVGALARVVAFWTLKIAFFYPFRTIRRTMKALKKKKSIPGETASA